MTPLTIDEIRKLDADGWMGHPESGANRTVKQYIELYRAWESFGRAMGKPAFKDGVPQPIDEFLLEIKAENEKLREALEAVERRTWYEVSGDVLEAAKKVIMDCRRYAKNALKERTE